MIISTFCIKSFSVDKSKDGPILNDRRQVLYQFIDLVFNLKKDSLKSNKLNFVEELKVNTGPIQRWRKMIPS